MKKIIIAGFCLIVIFAVLRWHSVSFFAVKQYRCSQDGIIAPDYFSSIDTAVGNLLHDKVSAHSIIKQLQNQFPLLHTITLSYRPTVTQITMSAQEPACCINNALILTQEGELLPKDNFSDNAGNVPMITMAASAIKRLSPLLLPLLHELPADFNQHYDLDMVNEHDMRLVDKDKPQFTAVFSASQKDISTILAHCDEVKKNLDARKNVDKSAQWMVDTRFADYIVAYKT